MSPTSTANVQPQNFELSPCRVNYKSIDLGGTLGNVKVNIEEMLSDLKADQLGQTVIDRKSSGFKMTVETMLAESQLKDNWKVVFPAHKLITQGGLKSFYFDSTVGTSMLDNAGLLVLHPLSKPDTDKSGDILIWKATAEGKADITYSPTEQQKIKVTWHMYPDFTTSPPRFALFGDPTIGLVDASHGAATAGTGNVGDGTIGSITVFNGTTKTETITAQCVTPGTGGAFIISGSQSGSLGLAQIGVTFNSQEISLVVNNGGTPFALNDSFTIATVAANYI